MPYGKELYCGQSAAVVGCGSGAGVKQSGMLPVVVCKAGKGEFNPLQTVEFVLLYWFRQLLQR